MTSPRQATVTRLLDQVRDGNRDAFGPLFQLLYDELRGLARRERRGGRGGAILDTHALVHEAYMKLVDQSKPDWRSRGHFSAVAATAMRHILVDYARRQGAAKRGHGVPGVPLNEVAEVVPDSLQRPEPETLIVLNQALRELERESAREARIVELKFFGGMTISEIAEVLEISPATVKRSWVLARTWLYRAMGGRTE